MVLVGKLCVSKWQGLHDISITELLPCSRLSSVALVLPVQLLQGNSDQFGVKITI